MQTEIKSSKEIDDEYLTKAEADKIKEEQKIEKFLRRFKKRLIVEQHANEEKAEDIIAEQIRSKYYDDCVSNARIYCKDYSLFIDVSNITDIINKEEQEAERKQYKKDLKEQKKKDKEEEEIEETSLILDQENIIEQIIKNNKCLFLIYNKTTHKIIEANTYTDKYGITYKPIDSEEVHKGAIGLPTNAEDYGEEKQLDAQIEQYINQWLDVTPEYLQFAIWNIKRSWVFQKFHSINYLRARGDFGTGKTRYLDVLGSLHYKPLFTSGATTPAPVFRMIERWRGTLVMDEADFSKSDEAQDMIKIINLGLEKGKFILRCDQNNAKNVELFDPYCPKVLATRRGFSDRATESRCMTLIMKGTNRKDIPVNLNDKFKEETIQIRNKLLMWRFKNYERIDPDAGEKIDFGDIEPRVKQIATSYVSLFAGDKDLLFSFKKFINKHQQEIISERQDTREGSIIGAIRDLLEDGKKDITVTDIIEKAALKDFNGNPTKPRSLSNPLKSLGINIGKPKKVDGKTKKCLFLDIDFLNDLFKKYGYPVTQVTLVTETSTNDLNLSQFGEPIDD